MPVPHQLTLGSMFTGYGGLDLAVADVLGTRTRWCAENDPHAAAVLAARFPGVSNFGDVTTVDWSAAPRVDVVAAGFPCQDLSLAGRRRGLAAGTRSGLWSAVVAAVAELKPRLVVVENVPGLLSQSADHDMEPCPTCMGDPADAPRMRALGRVLADLAVLGFDAEWTSVAASETGAPHRRNRVFLVAWPAHEDTDAAAGHLGRVDAPGGAPRRRARADARRRGRASTADAAGIGHGNGGTPPGRRVPAAAVGSDHPEADQFDWGPYAPAIQRWEHVTGRAAPEPTMQGRNGPRLSPAFVEWMMGLRRPWVTGLGLTRGAELKILGEGVVPSQAAAALEILLNRAPAGVLEEAR